MRIGVAADHGGFDLKLFLAARLLEEGYEVVDFGAQALVPGDDYPDFVVPLAEALSRKDLDRGIAICGSGVGASIAANKIRGIRAALVHEPYSAHQGVEDDDMNLICLGGHVLGRDLAWELARIFLRARFKGLERYRRRLAKIEDLEGHR